MDILNYKEETLVLDEAMIKVSVKDKKGKTHTTKTRDLRGATHALLIHYGKIPPVSKGLRHKGDRDKPKPSETDIYLGEPSELTKTANKLKRSNLGKWITGGEIVKLKETFELDEGVNDPGIFKAVILAGGPGSGKTHVAKKLGLGSMGLIVVNSDLFFMQLMKRKGLSLKMPANELEAREVARLAAKGHTDRRLKSLVDARMGVIVDSTSGDQAKTTKIVKMLKKSGYDVKVVFIETTLEVALARNTKRARTLPDAVVEFSWKGAQAVKKTLKSLAGTINYHEVVNNVEGKVNVSGLSGKLTVWARRLNPTALEWIKAVKSGQDSMKTEDINTDVRKSFKDFTEALTITQRLKMGRIAKRTAKKRARKAKIKAKKMKNAKEIQAKAGMMARNKMAKKLTGGLSLSQLTVQQKIALGKKLETKKVAIVKLTKKYLRVARKLEKERLGKLHATKEHRIQ